MRRRQDRGFAKRLLGRLFPIGENHGMRAGDFLYMEPHVATARSFERQLIVLNIIPSDDTNFIGPSDAGGLRRLSVLRI